MMNCLKCTKVKHEHASSERQTTTSMEAKVQISQTQESSIRMCKRICNYWFIKNVVNAFAKNLKEVIVTKASLLIKIEEA